MNRVKLTAFLLSILLSAPALFATEVRVRMNNTSPTMTLNEMSTGNHVDVGQPDDKKDYRFTAAPGRYRLTAFAKDGETVNGSIVFNVAADSISQEFTVLTNTVYATNKHDDEQKTQWTIENGDYTLECRVNSREGEIYDVTPGKSVTAGRYTLLALNGNSYYVTFVPSEAHVAEGYTRILKSGTLTGGINISTAIPKGENYTISVPKEAEFALNIKYGHFVDFMPVAPVEEVVEGDVRRITYYLALGQVYNYRTSMAGKLTRAGYFTMSANEEQRPSLVFTAADYDHDPALINHSPMANGGYETGNIWLNINPRGHLRMKNGGTFKTHAMRNWQVTDNSTNNYFMEPDFHYTVTDTDGNPSANVVTVEQKPGSAWAELKAVGEGTAIVLVTYDAIGCNFFSKAEKKDYMGGEIWGAIWPENTAVFVVTVGGADSAVEPNMLINENYNSDTLKLAGLNVDAEHDVFYYLDTEDGATYSFRPENAVSVDMAYPVIGERMALYKGFSEEGVTRNDDGSYTLLLKHGRQIVRLTDAAGNSVYQVITARECHRELVNVSRPGSRIFQPGDRVTVQYSGLYHPASKLAGIYNMSAYVTYNGVPNGTSLILGAGQYTFGSVASAQAVNIDIPADYDVEHAPVIAMTEGVIQVNGYGDPIGNHRNIDDVAGRSPNFTAVPHKTYFGHIPDVAINISAVRNFDIKVDCDRPGADVKILYLGEAMTPDENGLYNGTYGNYAVTVTKPGFRCYRHTFNIPDDAEGLQTFDVALTPGDNLWDGVTKTEPIMDDGRYLISDGAELAWFAADVNSGRTSVKGELTADIDLGDYQWIPIGTSAMKFAGRLSGNGHAVKGLYIDGGSNDYTALFGIVQGSDADNAAVIEDISVYGVVNAEKNAAGLVGNTQKYVSISRCANYAEVSAVKQNAGGIVAYVSFNSAAITDCLNAGSVSAPTNAGGIVGYHTNNALNVSNVLNVGEITGVKNIGGCAGGSAAKTGLENAYVAVQYDKTEQQTLVSDAQLRSGEVAFLLGAAFGQRIGTDSYPYPGGEEVLYDAAADRYYNLGDLTGAGTLTAEKAVPVAYYNATGLCSTRPFKGVNIVVMSDGSRVKIIF